MSFVRQKTKAAFAFGGRMPFTTSEIMGLNKRINPSLALNSLKYSANSAQKSGGEAINTTTKAVHHAMYKRIAAKF